MVDIEVSQETTNRLHAILSGLGKADEKVLKPAMRRGLTAGRTAFNKQIKSVYYVSPAVISRYSHIGYKKVEMRSDGLIGSIEYAGTVIPLIKYNVTPQKATYGKTPVKAAVKRSESQVEFAKSFTAQMPNGHIGIYERILSMWSKVDKKLNKRLIESVTQSINIWLNGLMAEEKILGGRVEFLEEENTTTDLLTGKAKFHIYLTPPSPAKELDFVLEYDVSYLENIFA